MRCVGLLLFFLVGFCMAIAQPSRLDDFVSKLKAKSYSNDLKLLKSTLAGSHKEFLKNYKAYSKLDDVYSSGNFDCLSGTILISSIFDRLNIKYKIYETNYHIFLMVQTSTGEAIVETTDKDNGLITNRSEIKTRLNLYKGFGKGSAWYLSKVEIFNEINQEQIVGLTLFNQSVSSFLEKDFVECVHFLERAKDAYSSPRISEFAKVVIQQITLNDGIEKPMKDDLISRLKTFAEDKISFASATH